MAAASTTSQEASPRRPRHVAIVMDGNGRWAEARGRPRTFGHKAGVASVRTVVEASARAGIEALTLFAFSSENWRRPRSEVSVLMDLFLASLRREVKRLGENDVRLRVVGGRDQLAPKLREQIAAAEAQTRDNTGLQLCIAANYGGRWDIVEAARRVARAAQEGTLDPARLDETEFARGLALADLPPPDLFIRTGGESRISNFLLWQLAYSELYFTDTLWPDFDDLAYQEALAWYAGRQRRFGRTPAQARHVAGA
ncbi:MAG: polyprenyl diphosphate synthase [Gammaproteobacteria bacterium]|nr:polyprenyl diphosphate synthase [Gammaproteobacteria bacterium]